MLLLLLQAIQLRPNFADAYSNLASAYKDGGDIQHAIQCYKRAIDIKPDFPDAFANLVHRYVCENNRQ
jgi:protein O-GlcNAc transferase